jgi:ankyrin repeat protein
VQCGRSPLYSACYNGHMEVVKLLLAHSDVAVNQAATVRRRGGVGRERGHRVQRSWVHTNGLRWRAAPLTLTMLSWGAMLGRYVQRGDTPLYRACYTGHVEVVELLLAHSDVNVNTSIEVRGRGRAGRERKHGGQRSWVHTNGLRRRAAHTH